MPTELVELESRHMYEDFLYEMENGSYYHFEFESDAVSESDLRRFREYEASTVRIYGAPVVTYVICSSKVKTLRDRITDGINTYRVRLIRLKDADAEAILYTFAVKFLDRQEIRAIKEEMAMTILGQMIWDDALEKGMEKGRKEESERYSRLILKLNEEGKTDLLVKTASDPEYRETLYKEYGI